MPTIKLYQIMARDEHGREYYVNIERNERLMQIHVKHVDEANKGTLFNGEDIEKHVIRLNNEFPIFIYFQVDTPYVFNEDTGEIINETSSL